MQIVRNVYNRRTCLKKNPQEFLSDESVRVQNNSSSNNSVGLLGEIMLQVHCIADKTGNYQNAMLCIVQKLS